MAKQKTPAQTPATNVLYVVTDKGMVVAGKTGNTVQRPEADKPFGSGWRAAGYVSTNTRAVVLSALLDAGAADGLAEPDTLGVIAKCGKDVLRSGTPRSYFAAFVKAGLLAELEI